MYKIRICNDEMSWHFSIRLYSAPDIKSVCELNRVGCIRPRPSTVIYTWWSLMNLNLLMFLIAFVAASPGMKYMEICRTVINAISPVKLEHLIDLISTSRRRQVSDLRSELLLVRSNRRVKHRKESMFCIYIAQ